MIRISSRLVSVLAPYGQQYVDELARAYLVLNDKDYLPMIIETNCYLGKERRRQRCQE